MSQKPPYLTDSYLKTLETSVASFTPHSKGLDELILDQTIFYPQGGGQPGDKGEIKSKTSTFKVKDTQFRNQKVIHLGKSSGNFAKGDSVIASLDWQNRYFNMRAHTAGHLIHEAIMELTPELKPLAGVHGVGNKFYLKYQGILDQSQLPRIQQLTNRIISQNDPITSEFKSKKELEDLNIPLPQNLPKSKALRIISIGDRVPMPDGGTQIKTASEVGTITITDISYENGQSLIHYKIKSNNNQKTTTKDTSLANQIKKVQSSLKTDIKKISPAKLETKYLSKKGLVNQLTKLIPQLSPEHRGEAGKQINQLKQQIQSDIKALQTKTPTSSGSKWIDVTLPGIPPKTGHLHLITEAIAEIEAIFLRLGFVRRRYPEIESDWYYAEGLNIPKDHPARDDQETFYLDNNVVLTAHTSNGQLREMEYLKKPPIKMINIGKTYRRQATNTHSPMFHQFEGLLVDRNINMTHLVGVSNYFAKQYFGQDREIRLRPHHFQFTEPSFEVDINCHLCKGQGKIKGKICKVCKSGWLELGGAGMVHPTVLKNGGIDTDKFSGFAFGWGIERIIMMKHQVTDNLRQLYTTDLRFLNQN